MPPLGMSVHHFPSLDSVPNPSNRQSEASPGRQREGLRSASRTNSTHRSPEDAALISSLRGALRAAIVRLEAHKKRDEQLEAEHKAMVEEHAAGTTYILTQGCRAAEVNGLFVEKELHAWNEEFRTKKDRASSRLAANYRSLEHDLESILSDVVATDALILEVSVLGPLVESRFWPADRLTFVNANDNRCTVGLKKTYHGQTGLPNEPRLLPL